MRAFVTVGLPGSGKSTWAWAQGLFEVNLDTCRKAVSGDESDQSSTPAAVVLRDGLITYLAAAGIDLVSSDTNLDPGYRAQLIADLRRLGYEVTLVIFDVPLAVCLERNRHRPRFVPEAAMARMDRQWREHSIVPDEGDHQVILGEDLDLPVHVIRPR